MNFIEIILDALQKMINFFASLFTDLINFLLKPLSWIVYFFDGVFYFINVLFQVLIRMVMIFVSLFQFLFAIGQGIFNTIVSFTNVSVTGQYIAFPSATLTGFMTFLDVTNPTGIMTIVPAVMTAFIWLFFVIKIYGLFGGQVAIRPFGKGD